MRSNSIALRSHTSAATVIVSAAIVAMKACNTSSDSLSLGIAKGPTPRTVDQVAISEISATNVATSRCPKRKAAHTSGGMQRNGNGYRLSAGCASTSAAVTTTTASKATASTGLSRRVPACNAFPQSTSKGVTITAPAASPSHQVSQMAPNALHEASPASASETTPIVALIVVQSSPASNAKRR